MKTNYTLFTYKITAIIILLFPISVYSQCSVSHTSVSVSNAANDDDVLYEYGQSFIATCSGNMQYFELISFETGTISAGTLYVFSGNTVTGTPIYSQSYPQIIITTAGSPITFSITGTVPLILNNQYTFVFTVDDVDFIYDEAGTYSGGEAWQDGEAISEVDIIFTISIDNNLGINDYTISKSKIYPNPSNTFIKISSLENIEKYTIYNALGEKTNVGTISNNEKIDIQDMVNGLYFLKFENGNTLKFRKE